MEIDSFIVENSPLFKNLDKENHNCNFIYEYVRDFIESPEQLNQCLKKILEYKTIKNEYNLNYESFTELQFHNPTQNKDYLILPCVYRLADFLILPERIVNTILKNCIEYVYLSNKWNEENFIPEVLKRNIQSFWETFFSKYKLVCRKVHEYTNRKETNDLIYYETEIFHSVEDAKDIFGETHRKISDKLNSHMNILEPNYIFCIEDLLDTMDRFIIHKNRKCNSVINLEEMNLFDFEELEKYFNDIEENKIKSLDLHHNMTKCDCSICIGTHINCSCKFHIEEPLHYQVYTLSEPEPDDRYLEKMSYNNSVNLMNYY